MTDSLQSRLIHFLATALMLCVSATLAGQDPLGPLDVAMEGFPYPYSVEYLPLTTEGQMIKMAYMDVAPAGKPNGRNVLLLHGRNFGGYYWENTIRFLSHAGYRVVVPDQIGFGKSSKPDIGLSFHSGIAEQRRPHRPSGNPGKIPRNPFLVSRQISCASTALHVCAHGKAARH